MSNDEERESAAIDRRTAIKKGATAAGVAGVVWAAPRVEGLSMRPNYAAASSAGAATSLMFSVPIASSGGFDLSESGLAGDVPVNANFQGTVFEGSAISGGGNATPMAPGLDVVLDCNPSAVNCVFSPVNGEFGVAGFGLLGQNVAVTFKYTCS